MNYKNHKSQITNKLKLRTEQGFTLIELSIVIVIIGLIVAGVVGGQVIVRQAALRSLVTEYNQYKVAVNAFKLEYDAVPGDFNKADQYWTGATAGNGDKKVFNWRTEAVRFWDHLERAELISGSYTGVQQPANPRIVGGVNVPSAKFGKGVLFSADHVSFGNVNTCASANTQRLFGVIDNVNLFIAAKPTANGCTILPFLEVKEAHGLDVKIDDGEPAAGILFSANQGATVSAIRCVDVATNDGANTDPLEVDYYLGNSGEVCRLMFRMQ